MNFILQPWQLLLLILVGWVNRQKQEIIEYLRTENQILRESHGKKRIKLNDNQRRRLAIKGKILGRKILAEITSIATPDTILRGTGDLSPINGTTAIGAGASDAPLLPKAPLIWSSECPARIQPGVTIASRVLWPIWGTRSRTQPSATS